MRPNNASSTRGSECTGGVKNGRESAAVEEVVVREQHSSSSSRRQEGDKREEGADWQWPR